MLIGFALLVCSLGVRRAQRSLPLPWWKKLGIGIGGFCGAMLGAKLPFALAADAELWSWTAWFAHGKTIMTGLAGGYLGVEAAKWTLDVQTKTGDTFAVPVALAVAIGRIGCFNAGCCFGQPTNLPWGQYFPLAQDDPPIARHPTQLYESVFHFAAAGVLLLLLRRGLFRGQLIKLYILTYLGYRFLTEFLRPELRLWGGLTAYQWGALALAPIFLVLWRLDRVAARRDVTFPKPDCVSDDAR